MKNTLNTYLRNLALAVLATLTFSTTVFAQHSVHGALGKTTVEKDFQNGETYIYVVFDNKYRSPCGSEKFYLTRPDWNDVSLLTRAVESGRVVYFDYKCEGGKNLVTHFRWN